MAFSLFIVLILLVVVLALASTVIAVAYVASRKLVKPPRKIGGWTPRDLGLDYEDFTFRTSDNCVLKGWLVKRDPRRVVVVVHGYTSSKWDEDYVKPAIEALGKAGYSVVAVDMRGHGESGCETTLGYRESFDVEQLVGYLRGMGFEKVALYGFSMGGAISIMAGSRARVEALVLDSPYVDIRESGRRWVARTRGLLGLLLRISYPLIMFNASRMIGVNPGELVMYKYAEKVKAPTLLVAPLRDDLISPGEYKKLEEHLRRSARVVEAWYPETRHVGAWRDFKNEYEARLKGFLEKYL
ncbi:MAG: alpha/beta fold hydrolase [Thermogladius sp.]|nr:alpha/beta fold hydrolase [Thermogladius sp.]